MQAAVAKRLTSRPFGAQSAEAALKAGVKLCDVVTELEAKIVVASENPVRDTNSLSLYDDVSLDFSVREKPSASPPRGFRANVRLLRRFACSLGDAPLGMAMSCLLRA